MNLMLLVSVVLLAFSGFFSASETAIFSLSTMERKRIATTKDWRSVALNSLLTHPSKTLSTILIGNMLVNTAFTCLFTLYALQNFKHEWFSIQLIGFTFVLLLTGEVLPKNVALSWNVPLSYLVAAPLLFCSYMFRPFIVLLLFLTRYFVKTVSKTGGSKGGFSEDDIKTLIQIGHEDGVMARGEADRLTNIFSFGERKVKEIMIPRPDMVSYDIDNGREGIFEIVKKKRCRYVVIYKDTIDTVIGIIFTKHILLHPDQNLKQLLTPPIYIPELQKIDAFLANMIVSKQDCAICVDEFGGTAGVISHDEIVDTIFGRLHEEEYEKGQGTDRLIEKHDNEYIVDGTISLYELNKLLKLEPGFDAEGYDSLGGFILDQLEQVPKEGLRVVAEEAELIIKSVDKHRIEKVLVRPKRHG
ncbi:MAG: HlyC/CorC family transporter [Candidatus Omnitrophica bacterium]|nr:HlyC/CorC family transporter [Candidatus Omnitrophota bacterium]